MVNDEKFEESILGNEKQQTMDISMELEEQSTIEESMEIKNLSNLLTPIILVDFICPDVLMDAKDSMELLNSILFKSSLLISLKKETVCDLLMEFFF